MNGTKAKLKFGPNTFEIIKKGDYVECAVSGKNIPKERLRAIPWAAERVEYKVGGMGFR